MAYDKTIFPALIKYVVDNNSNEFTYKEVGIHYATLNSLVKRGYLSKSLSGKYSLTTKGIMFAKIESSTIGMEYFVLQQKNAKLGMMCSIKGPDILDAWDNVLQLEGDFLKITFPIEQEIRGSLDSKN